MISVPEAKMRKAIKLMTVVSILLITSSTAIAFEAGNKINFNGYGSWGYGKTDNVNSYLIGNEDGNYSNFQFSLAISAKPAQNLTISALASWGESTDENDVEMEYAFAEWTFHETFRLRAGKIKHPFGIYTEVFNVGIVRPFFSLPQSIYGATGFVTRGYKGIGINGSYFTENDWGLTYDVYGGKMKMDFLLIFHVPHVIAAIQDAISGVSSEEPSEFADFYGSSSGSDGYGDLEGIYIEGEHEDVIGGRLLIHTPVDLTLGASFYRSKLIEQYGYADDSLYHVFGAQLEFLYRFLKIRSEYLRAELDDPEGVEEAFYVEASVRFLEHFQLAARYDWIEHDDVHPTMARLTPSLLEHTEYAVGLNYWFNYNLVIKLSYQIVEGNRLAIPENFNDLIMGGELEETTHLAVVGAQFSF